MTLISLWKTHPSHSFTIPWSSSLSLPPLSYNSCPLLQVYPWPCCHWQLYTSPAFYIQFFNLTAHCSLPFPLHLCFDHSKSCKLWNLLLLILHDPSHFSLFILFHIIISMYFRSSTLLPFVSSILLSSKKSLTLVISLALISCWQLKKSGGKHACLLTDSNFNSWPQILPGYSELPDYLYTFIYTCFSCSKIRPYHNFCISSNFQSVVQDAKHPLAPMSSHFPL